MAAPFTKLTTFPRHRLIDAEVARCRASELDLLAVFGEAAANAPADDPDPTFFWDVEWACGLVMDLQFHQLTEELVIRLDESDVAHALRHLGFAVHDLWSLEDDEPERFLELATPLPRRSILWVSESDGGSRPIATDLTERDATCWRDDLNLEASSRHWVTTDDG